MLVQATKKMNGFPESPESSKFLQQIYNLRLKEIFLIASFSECANTEQLGRQVLRKSSSWFDFSSSQIRTRDGWVRSENATAVLCRPPLKQSILFMGNGGGSVCRAVASYTRDSGFESRQQRHSTLKLESHHQQMFFAIYQL